MLQECHSLQDMNESNVMFYDFIVGGKKTPEEVAAWQLATVDVRDVADGHIRALEVPEAGGELAEPEAAEALGVATGVELAEPEAAFELAEPEAGELLGAEDASAVTVTVAGAGLSAAGPEPWRW